MRISALAALVFAAAFASGCGGAAVGCTRAAVKVGTTEAKFGAAGTAKSGAVLGNDALEAAARSGTHLGQGALGDGSVPLSRLGKPAFGEADHSAIRVDPHHPAWPHWATEVVKQGVDKLPQALGDQDARSDERPRERRTK